MGGCKGNDKSWPGVVRKLKKKVRLDSFILIRFLSKENQVLEIRRLILLTAISLSDFNS